MRANTRTSRLDGSILHLLHRAGQQAEGVFIVECPPDALTPRQYAVLLAVDNNPEISQTGLVEETGIDRSTLADVVARLVKKGLISRERTRTGCPSQKPSRAASSGETSMVSPRRTGD